MTREELRAGLREYHTELTMKAAAISVLLGEAPIVARPAVAPEPKAKRKAGRPAKTPQTQVDLEAIIKRLTPPFNAQHVVEEIAREHGSSPHMQAMAKTLWGLAHRGKLVQVERGVAGRPATYRLPTG